MNWYEAIFGKDIWKHLAMEISFWGHKDEQANLRQAAREVYKLEKLFKVSQTLFPNITPRLMKPGLPVISTRRFTKSTKTFQKIFKFHSCSLIQLWIFSKILVIARQEKCRQGKRNSFRNIQTSIHKTSYKMFIDFKD